MLATPPPSPRASGLAYEGVSLPTPPSSRSTRGELTSASQAFARYYWPRHFETNPADPASFIDRVMTDYAHYEGDVLGEWLDDMSTVYRIYKCCLQYGISHGTPAKAAEAKGYQGVVHWARRWLIWREHSPASLEFRMFEFTMGNYVPQE